MTCHTLVLTRKEDILGCEEDAVDISYHSNKRVYAKACRRDQATVVGLK